MILIYVILFVLVLRMFIAFSNLFFRPKLPPVNRLKSYPLVSILVRADNEVLRVNHLLNQLKGLEYPNLEVIVGTYKSSDETVKTICHYLERDDRFGRCEIPEMKKGWSAYNRINYLMGRKARGNYLLFIDGDIELRKGVLETLISYIIKKKLGLLAVLPVLEVHTKAERWMFSLLNRLYFSLLPLWCMSRFKTPHLASIAKKFLLFDGDIYRQFEPFEENRSSELGSWDFAKYLRKENVKLELLLGDKRISLEGCVSWKRCLVELSRHLLSFFLKSYFLAFLYGVFMLFWFVPFFIMGRIGLLFVAIILWLVTSVVVSMISGRPVKEYVLYAYPDALAFMVVLWVSLVHAYKKKKCRRRKTCID